jgi:hypothetical protein
MLNIIFPTLQWLFAGYTPFSDRHKHHTGGSVSNQIPSVTLIINIANLRYPAKNMLAG